MSRTKSADQSCLIMGTSAKACGKGHTMGRLHVMWPPGCQTKALLCRCFLNLFHKYTTQVHMIISAFKVEIPAPTGGFHLDWFTQLHTRESCSHHKQHDGVQTSNDDKAIPTFHCHVLHGQTHTCEDASEPASKHMHAWADGRARTEVCGHRQIHAKTDTDVQITKDSYKWGQKPLNDDFQ